MWDLEVRVSYDADVLCADDDSRYTNGASERAFATLHKKSRAGPTSARNIAASELEHTSRDVLVDLVPVQHNSLK